MTLLQDFVALDEKRQVTLPGSVSPAMLNKYYDGQQRVAQLGLSLPPQMRSLETVVNWPRLQVDSIAERMEVESFRVAERPELGRKAMDWWLANNLDAGQRLAHVEALVQGSAYIVVNVGENDEYPHFTIESNQTVGVSISRRTGRVEAASYVSDWDEQGLPTFGAYYLPDETVYFERSGYEWKTTEVRRHNLGVIPVFPMLNKARIDDFARPEITDILPITDAAARLMTNLQAAQEFLALPQRYILGATKEEFQDIDGNPIPAFEAYIGNYLAMASSDAKAGQFPGADLRNFVEVFQMYARIVASLSKLPPHRLGLASNNAVSADAIRSDEADLIVRIKDRMGAFETAWENAFRCAFKWMGVDVPEIQRLEVVWASPETPTFAAKSDAVSKLVGSEIIAKRSARKELFSPEKAAEYEADAEAEAQSMSTALDRALLFQEPVSGA